MAIRNYMDFASQTCFVTILESKVKKQSDEVTICAFIMKNWIKTSSLLGCLAAFSILSSCKDENEDLVKTPPQKGVIEASISTKSMEGYCILETSYKVKDENGISRLISRIDTIPCLKDTTIIDDDGKLNTFQKQYEIYLDIK